MTQIWCSSLTWTLTNAKDETHVRGGNNTIEALRRAKSKGAQMFIVSAANPTKIAVDSAVGQLMDCFLTDNMPEFDPTNAEWDKRR